jgi:hypothetical protein
VTTDDFNLCLIGRREWPSLIWELLWYCERLLLLTSWYLPSCDLFFLDSQCSTIASVRMMSLCDWHFSINPIVNNLLCISLISSRIVL